MRRELDRVLPHGETNVITGLCRCLACAEDQVVSASIGSLRLRGERDLVHTILRGGPVVAVDPGDELRRGKKRFDALVKGQFEVHHARKQRSRATAARGHNRQRLLAPALHRHGADRGRGGARRAGRELLHDRDRGWFEWIRRRLGALLDIMQLVLGAFGQWDRRSKDLSRVRLLGDSERDLLAVAPQRDAFHASIGSGRVDAGGAEEHRWGAAGQGGSLGWGCVRLGAEGWLAGIRVSGIQDSSRACCKAHQNVESSHRVLEG